MGISGTNLIISAVPEKSCGRERQNRAGISFARINGKKRGKFR